MRPRYSSTVPLTASAVLFWISAALAEGPASPVTLAEITTETLRDQAVLSGTTEAPRRAALSPWVDGLVTELIEPVVEGSSGDCRIVCCGPEPMMDATAKIARRLEVPCQVSLETPMACGIGICFSCVAKIRDTSGAWDYRRTCVEGPVFDAERVEFD